MALTLVGDAPLKDMTEREAREFTDSLKVDLADMWEKIAEAYTRRAWAALGYQDWDTYCSAEFGSVRLRLPHEEREQAIGSLRDHGLSVRAIAAATGESKSAIHRATLSGVPSGTPDRPTQGTDGKKYPRAKPIPRNGKYVREHAKEITEAAGSEQGRAEGDSTILDGKIVGLPGALPGLGKLGDILSIPARKISRSELEQAVFDLLTADAIEKLDSGDRLKLAESLLLKIRLCGYQVKRGRVERDPAEDALRRAIVRRRS